MELKRQEAEKKLALLLQKDKKIWYNKKVVWVHIYF